MTFLPKTNVIVTLTDTSVFTSTTDVSMSILKLIRKIGIECRTPNNMEQFSYALLVVKLLLDCFIAANVEMGNDNKSV